MYIDFLFWEYDKKSVYILVQRASNKFSSLILPIKKNIICTFFFTIFIG